MENRVITFGASAGGIGALTKVVSKLPEDIPASLFVVQHTTSEAPGYLDSILERAGRLKAKYAAHGEYVRTGTIYIAPPDNHLLLKDGYVLLTRGPKENRFRPSIDPLFRSAAASHGPRTIGVILSGTLDDGIDGLHAIKRCGGVACIQDPKDAEFPEMPLSAMRTVAVDFVSPAGEMGAVLDRIARRPNGADVKIPIDIVSEVEMAEKAISDIGIMDELGKRSPFVCPECGGGLWEMKNEEFPRFRCNTGHAYGISSLLEAQNETVEASLWAAVRSLEERAKILMRLADDSKRKDRPNTAKDYTIQAEESRAHAQHIRNLLLAKFGEPVHTE